MRPTHTPAMLITRRQIKQQLQKILDLAAVDERRKAFWLLVMVLVAGGKRRRARPGGTTCPWLAGDSETPCRWSRSRGSICIV
ncbi:DUF5958 family protein [Streptomyces sp. NPDC002057]|uniref:DUF5958 family protein n=1 Tax=Streptomyces sp. NPDC002057 TaxID=3154664 RepID=UPI00332EADCF